VTGYPDREPPALLRGGGDPPPVRPAFRCDTDRVVSVPRGPRPRSSARPPRSERAACRRVVELLAAGRSWPARLVGKGGQAIEKARALASAETRVPRQSAVRGLSVCRVVQRHQPRRTNASVPRRVAPHDLCGARAALPRASGNARSASRARPAVRRGDFEDAATSIRPVRRERGPPQRKNVTGRSCRASAGAA
jgi:hypothetical protein